MANSFKEVLFSNQGPGLLYRDIARAIVDAGIPLRQVVPRSQWVLDPAEVETIFGCTRDTRTAVRRIWTWGRFTLRALWSMIRHRKSFGLLVTNPPFVAWVAPLAKKLFGFRYGVIMYDLYPDILVSLSMLKANGLLHRLFRWINGVSLRNAEVIITIGRCMKRTTAEYLPDSSDIPIHVVHNWVDIDEIRPTDKQDNLFAIEHGLVDKFVVMYSGNWSPTHGLDLVVELADELRDIKDLAFMLIGEGGCKKQIEEDVNRRQLPNLKILPFLPHEMFRYSVASADCQIVSLDKAFYGISMPSKTYAALAAGCAILAVTPEATELQAIVEQYDCGVRIPPRDLDSLRQAVLAYCNDRDLLARHKANSRKMAELHANGQICTAEYIRILKPYLEDRCHKS